MIQKLFLKLFQWRISVKIEKLNEEEKAKYLLCELIKAVQNSGKSFHKPKISKDFGSATLYFHNMDNSNASVTLECGCGNDDWKIEIKPNFKFREVK